MKAAEDPPLVSELLGSYLAVFDEYGCNPLTGRCMTPGELKDARFLTIVTAGTPFLRALGALRPVAARGTTTVYRSINAAGEVQYVGITNNLARRAAEHLRGTGIQIEKLMGGLSRSDARAVEQALIEIHGLGKNGGTLNSISPLSPAYRDQLARGYELLQSIGY